MLCLLVRQHEKVGNSITKYKYNSAFYRLDAFFHLIDKRQENRNCLSFLSFVYYLTVLNFLIKYSRYCSFFIDLLSTLR